MVSKYDHIIPTLLIPQIYYPYCNEKGAIINIIKKVTEDGFYGAIEIDNGYDKYEREQIRKTAIDKGFFVTQWLTSLIDKKRLDLSSIDVKSRKYAVQSINEALYFAAEAGVSNVAVISGPNPGASLQKDAMESLFQSLCEICLEAAKYNMKVLIEPLDRDVHKNKLLGTTKEAFSLINNVRKHHQNIGLAFDTAHAALNGENIKDALDLALPAVEQLHFSNAVLNKKSKLYGDHHLPIGGPGFLHVQSMKDILGDIIVSTGVLETGLRVSIEVQGTKNQSFHENEFNTRKLLSELII